MAAKGRRKAFCDTSTTQGLNCTDMNQNFFFNVPLTTFFYRYFCPVFAQKQDNN